MDWADTPEQAAFRAEVVAFIEQRLPRAYRERGDGTEHAYTWYRDRASDDVAIHEAAYEWARALAERGWVAAHWPREYGGAGLSVWEQFIFNTETARAKVPLVGGTGMKILGPTLMLHGTDEQKRRYLPRILSTEMLWVQGNSEPSAGSDLANVQTRAVRAGDEYLVTGQKMWTSAAQFATSMFSLVRTDSDLPKHRGLSFLLVDDLRAPGITVRPLTDMGWQDETNEVFLDDVRVPLSNRVGAENDGWRVSMTLMDFERSGISGAIGQMGLVYELIDTVAHDERSRLRSNLALRGRLADRAIAVEVAYNFSLRIASMQAAGLVPNYEASTGKLVVSEHEQELHRVGVNAFGLYGNLWGDPERALLGGKHTRQYVRSIPSTIAGGSNEIQRNIIATRGLGLPRD